MSWPHRQPGGARGPAGPTGQVGGQGIPGREPAPLGSRARRALLVQPVLRATRETQAPPALRTTLNPTFSGDVTIVGQLSANGGRLRTSSTNNVLRCLTVNGNSDADPVVVVNSTGSIRLNRNVLALGNLEVGAIWWSMGRPHRSVT
jgi:hypothetical protein